MLLMHYSTGFTKNSENESLMNNKRFMVFYRTYQYNLLLGLKFYTTSSAQIIAKGFCTLHNIWWSFDINRFGNIIGDNSNLRCYLHPSLQRWNIFLPSKYTFAYMIWLLKINHFQKACFKFQPLPLYCN